MRGSGSVWETNLTLTSCYSAVHGGWTCARPWACRAHANASAKCRSIWSPRERGDAIKVAWPWELTLAAPIWLCGALTPLPFPTITLLVLSTWWHCSMKEPDYSSNVEEIWGRLSPPWYLHTAVIYYRCSQFAGSLMFIRTLLKALVYSWYENVALLCKLPKRPYIMYKLRR